MDKLRFGTQEYWQVCSYHTYREKDYDLNSKILAGSGILEEIEVQIVWEIYASTSSIIYRVHCLVSLAEYWQSKQDYKKIKGLKDIFNYLVENSFCFYKDGFLAKCEQDLIKRIVKVFQNLDKSLLVNLITENCLKVKSVISLINIGLLDSLDIKQRKYLKDYFSENIRIYFEYPQQFNKVFQYFEKKQEKFYLQILGSVDICCAKKIARK